jgi:hypothetical protein
MKKKEIKEKFEKLGEQIKGLEKGQADLYEVTQFILEAIGKYTDEPIYRVKKSYNPYGCYGCAIVYILQYAYNNRVKEIETCTDIQSVELFAHCDTHFILKNHNNKYFLVDMAKGVITNIPAQLLFSKGMNLTIEGQVLKVCHTESGVLGVRND